MYKTEYNKLKLSLSVQLELGKTSDLSEILS